MDCSGLHGISISHPLPWMLRNHHRRGDEKTKIWRECVPVIKTVFEGHESTTAHRNSRVIGTVSPWLAQD